MNENSTNIGTLGLADDSGMGLAMFVIFTAACLIVTGAVAILAFINAWWVLGLAFGIHVLMTTAVGYAVFSALSGGAPSLREPARRGPPMRPRRSSLRRGRGSSGAMRTQLRPESSGRSMQKAPTQGRDAAGRRGLPAFRER